MLYDLRPAIVKTFTKVIEDGDDRRIRIQCRLELRQSGVFAITSKIADKRRARDGSWRGRWATFSSGQCYQDYAEHLPEIAHLFKWHLVNAKTGPMHYVESAVYWATHSDWTQAGRNVERLARTICYGALPEDAEVDLRTISVPDLRHWLEDRKPRLLAALKRDMVAFFGMDKMLAKEQQGQPLVAAA